MFTALRQFMAVPVGIQVKNLCIDYGDHLLKPRLGTAKSGSVLVRIPSVHVTRLLAVERIW